MGTKKKNKKSRSFFRVSVVFYCMQSTHTTTTYYHLTTTITTTMQWPSLYFVCPLSGPFILFKKSEKQNKKLFICCVASFCVLSLYLSLSFFLCVSGYTAAIWNAGAFTTT